MNGFLISMDNNLTATVYPPLPQPREESSARVIESIPYSHPPCSSMQGREQAERLYVILKSAAVVLLVAALILATASGSAHAGTISQVPLFVSLEGVNPNIMFIIDDSGSMRYEITPDDYRNPDISRSHGGSVRFVYPRVDKVYAASGEYENTVATVDHVAYNALARSPQTNKTYYNPSITYTPWIRHDGSLYPDAVPSAAYHNPAKPSAGSRNLTANNANSSVTTYWQTCTSPTSCSSTTTSKTFWPATYFWRHGGDEWNLASYSGPFEIRSTTATYSGHGREKRTDCSGGICTYAQEIQNFANWYTYYRSRILAARAGIGRAFEQQGEGLRVGFGAINKSSSMVDGSSITTIVRGVRSFTGSQREEFFNLLYTSDIPNAGTPLRQALDDAGKYFSRTDNRGPWADVPGSVSGSSYSCRRSYTILMTDGYWNSAAAGTTDARANNDGAPGPTIAGPDEQSHTYSTVPPFADAWTDTLADVAMYYWKRDLHPGLENRVLPTTLNPAFWQHMVTFGVGLGVFGTIDPASAFAAIDSGSTVSWPQPSMSGATENIDDLLHAAVNSRGGFFSAADPETFATELAGALWQIVSREESSASMTATNSTKLDTDTITYQAKFNSDNWSGQLIAYMLDSNGTLGALRWNTDAAGKIPAHVSRKIYTLVGNTGKEFLWSNLDASQKTALKTLGGTVSSDAVGQQRLNWIRGDQGNEKPGGALRRRTRLLGDIVNSDPFHVGAPMVDPRHLALPGYAAFLEATRNRTPMVYVGANDGMLHAFHAQTGVEQFAYIPKAVYPHLAELTSLNYGHRYFVDGSPVVGDARIQGVWKSVLIGATGAGGRAVFALDVTDPDRFSDPGTGADHILWEFAHPDLGYTIGRPTLGRIGDTWVVVFGNGYNSDNGKAFLFVVPLDAPDQYIKIATNDATDNGLAAPALLADATGSLVAAYAGDLSGNLWKFDLTSNSVAFGNPLFQARDAGGNVQPITALPEIAKHPDGGYLIFFGTGKYFEVGDHSAGATPVHSFYGIWDTATLNASGGWEGGDAISQTNRGVLQKQEIVGESLTAGNNWRLVSKNSIAWEGAGARRGWYVDLVVKDEQPVGERVTDAPRLDGGRVIFTTRIPFNSGDPCIPSVGTSWLMAINMLDGGRLARNVFDVNRDGVSSDSDYITVKGESGVASGFETLVAGMAQAHLLRSSKGIDVLLSGTTDLSTTAGATSAAEEAPASTVRTAIAAARSAGTVADAKAAQATAARTAADAARTAAEAEPGNAEAAVAAENAAAAAQTAADAAAAAHRTAAGAVAAAAGAVAAAAQALIDAGGGVVNPSRAKEIRQLAEAIRNEAQPFASAGDPPPPDLGRGLIPLAAELQGQSGVGASMFIQLSRRSWQQLW